jgi:hypothetical protein
MKFVHLPPAMLLAASMALASSPVLSQSATAVVAAPKAVSPAHGAVVGEADPKAAVALRWTPVIPRPQEPTTYRVKVWQLMQGQTGPQAMRANQPVFTKDVDNITQAFTAPPDCRQKGCSFVWTVQALNRDGKPIGENNGTSEPFDFTTPGAAGNTKRWARALKSD